MRNIFLALSALSLVVAFPATAEQRKRVAPITVTEEMCPKPREKCSYEYILAKFSIAPIRGRTEPNKDDLRLARNILSREEQGQMFERGDQIRL